MSKASFDWDLAKDRANQEKHGLSFAQAQYAFADPNRVIAKDITHSDDEDRFYCFGQVGEGIATIGEKVNEFMSTKIKYSNEPLGKVEVVADMLPSPEELAFKEDSVKVTISLSKSSVDFFKREAKKHDTKYQQMIRRLLDAYTRAQDRHITNR